MSTVDKSNKVTVRQENIRGKAVWVVNRREDGKRKRSYFEKRNDAEVEASRLRGGAIDLYKSWTALPVAEQQRIMSAYIESQRLGVDLLVAVTRAAENNSGGAGPALKTVIAELVAAKKAANRAKPYVDSLDLILSDFAKGHEDCPINHLNLSDVETYLAGKKMVSRPTLRARLSALFGFAINRGYRSDNPCDRLETVHIDKSTPRIFTPEELNKCREFFRTTHKSEKHSPSMSYRYGLPWFILTTACGLRPWEADKVHRKLINFEEGFVRVEISKVRQRRVVYPKPEAMAALKRSLSKGRLPLHPHARKRMQHRLRHYLGWKEWPRDVTRHTAASNWLGDCRSAADVAESLGNSEQVLNRNYKALVTKAEAKAFWEFIKNL